MNRVNGFTLVAIVNKENEPYKVVEMEEFMINLMDVCNHYCKSVGKDTSGKTVMGQTRILKVEKDRTDLICLKNSYDEELFREISVALPEQYVTTYVSLSVLPNETTHTKAKKRWLDTDV